MKKLFSLAIMMLIVGLVGGVKGCFDEGSELIITTFAGTGVYDFGGDGGQAIEAQLIPQGMVTGEFGMYFADAWNNRVRKIDPAGIITTVAGNGDTVYNGDNIPATSASLYLPYDVDLSDSFLYIADRNHNLVRRVYLPTGEIQAFAGSGQEWYDGDGVPATDAAIGMPHSVKVDATGNVYIADTINNRIRRVDATTGIITTVAGTGQAGRRGDGGPATEAQLNYPTDVELDFSGNLFIADSSNGVVRKIDAATGIITSLPYNPCCVTPFRLVWTMDTLYVADWSSNRVLEITPDGETSVFAGTGSQGYSGDGGDPLLAKLQYPQGVSWFADVVYIADTANYRIRKVE